MHMTVNLTEISRYVSRNVKQALFTSTAQRMPVDKETKKILEKKNTTCKQIAAPQEDELKKVQGVIIRTSNQI